MQNEISPEFQVATSPRPFVVVPDPLPLRLDAHGTYRVGRTRVTLDTVVFAHNKGFPAEEIVRHYPILELADVHAVIGYYLRHKEDVDGYLAQRERQAKEWQQRMEAEGHTLSKEKAAEIKRRFEERQNRKD